MSSVEQDRASRSHGPSPKVPNERGKQPGPPQQLARTERLDEHGAVGGLVRLEHNLPCLYQVQPVRRLSFMEENFFGFERQFYRAVDDNIEMVRFHSFEAGLGPDYGFD